MASIHDIKQSKRKLLSRDEVSDLMRLLERMQRFSSEAQTRVASAVRIATLLEIMEIFEAAFEDREAAGNALYLFWEFNELRGVED